MAFNPKEALQRIRQNKAAAAVPANRGLDDPSIDSSPHLLFDEYRLSQLSSKISDVRERVLLPVETMTAVNQLSRKVENLEKLTRDLMKDLSDSNMQIDRLKREKSELETHVSRSQMQILKLQYQNTQIRNGSKANLALRDIKTKRQTPEKDIVERGVTELSPQTKVSLQNTVTNNNPKQSIVNKFTHLQNTSQLPETVLQPVLKESINSLLHKKERNFKVIKNAASNRQQWIQAGNTHLVQLARVMKQYPEMERPVVIIDLKESQFE